MANDVIVAVYDSPTRAADAAQELQAAGIPASAIHLFDRQHPAWNEDTAVTTEARPQGGFWAWLFGTDEGWEADHRIYDETVARGGTVVSITAGTADHDRIMAILERHNPVDLDESGREAGTRSSVDISTGVAGTASAAAATTADAARSGETRGEKVIPLAEEQLQVGKRMVETGRTRIRRYVVETPIEERVRLRTERVVVERRRPVAGNEPSPDAFTETVTDVTERSETPVVAKVARVGEEVVVHTEADEREETVRDKVRREDVEVTRDGKTGAAGGTTGAAGNPAKRPGV